MIQFDSYFSDGLVKHHQLVRNSLIAQIITNLPKSPVGSIFFFCGFQKHHQKSKSAANIKGNWSHLWSSFGSGNPWTTFSRSQAIAPWRPEKKWQTMRFSKDGRENRDFPRFFSNKKVSKEIGSCHDYGLKSWSCWILLSLYVVLFFGGVHGNLGPI